MSIRIQDHKNQQSINFKFLPHPLIRHHYLQTLFLFLFFSLPKLGRSKITVQSTAKEMILDAGGVRLQGYYSPQPGGRSKGLVLVMHGWLGGANSNYVIEIGEYLYRHGYSIFRLNLRDHGDTHHLNPGSLHGNLLDELFMATQKIAQLEGERPFHIVGRSLGGNFAVRLAWRHSQIPLPNLVHTIGINPVLNLYNSTMRLDTAPQLYRAYFQRRWHRYMYKKKKVCPDLHDLSEMTAAPTFMDKAEVFVRHYSTYSDTEAYFADYTITPEMLATLQSPVTMIAAADDTLVPISDFYPFQNLTSSLKVHIQPHGGHIGYVDFFPFRYWVREVIRHILEN